MMLEHVLVLSAFFISYWYFGLITSRNMVRALMGLELILNSVNIHFVTFSDMFDDRRLRGDILPIFIIDIATAEATIGLSMFHPFIRINQSNLLNK